MFRDRRKSSTQLLAIWCTALVFLLVVFLVGLNGFYDRLINERKAAAKSRVEHALILTGNFYRLAVAGHLAPEEAKARALTLLEHQTQGDNSYYWVTRGAERLLMHPILPALEGLPLMELQEQGGDTLAPALAEVLRDSGAGFVDYQWRRNTSSHETERKSGYVSRFVPWNWGIGSSLYIADINQAFWYEARALVAVFSVLVAVLLIFWFGFEKALFTDVAARPGFASRQQVPGIQSRRRRSETAMGEG